MVVELLIVLITSPNIFVIFIWFIFAAELIVNRAVDGLGERMNLLLSSKS